MTCAIARLAYVVLLVGWMFWPWQRWLSPKGRLLVFRLFGGVIVAGAWYLIWLGTRISPLLPFIAFFAVVGEGILENGISEMQKQRLFALWLGVMLTGPMAWFPVHDSLWCLLGHVFASAALAVWVEACRERARAARAVSVAGWQFEVLSATIYVVFVQSG